MAEPVVDPKDGDAGNDPAPSIPVTDVKDLVGGFKDMLAEVKDAVAARPAPVPTPAPKVDDSIERKAAAQVKYEAAREKVNEQLASGEGAAAMETFMEGVLGIQSDNAPDPENNPQVKAGIASAKKLSRAENREMFDKYSDEITADMAALPAEERINPESWDAAVNRAKAAHIDDIISAREAQNAEDIKKAEEDARANTVAAPVAQRGRGTHITSQTLSADDLNEAQLDAAESCGLTGEQYATAVENYEKHTQKGGNVLFLNEPTKGLKIKPGAF